MTRYYAPGSKCPVCASELVAVHGDKKTVRCRLCRVTFPHNSGQRVLP